jgi:hypothetical protein
MAPLRRAITEIITMERRRSVKLDAEVNAIICRRRSVIFLAAR